MFSFDLPLLSWIFLGVEAIVVLLLLIFILRPLKAVGKMKPASPHSEISSPDVSEIISSETSSDSSEVSASDAAVASSDSPESSETEKSMPKVSVVVYSTVNEDVLTEYLKTVCAQDYPDFEVIVVCDASFETSGILSEKYGDLFRNVYVTFIPPGSHNLSRRKLALTLGIKAAKGEVVITTIANSRIPSDQWISTMVAPFIDHPEIELSLGYSHPDYDVVSGPGKYYKEFFALLTDARWIGYALKKKTYRGDGANLAMRRDTFFRCKGYSKTMHLHTGDDDLFVHDIADKDNTAVAISPESILVTEWGPASKRIFNLRRSQYDFTARWLPLGPFVRAGLASLCQWMVLLFGVASALLALPSLIPAIAAFVIWVTMMSIESSFYRRAALKLGATPLSWQVPLFWLIKPLNNLYFRSAHHSSRFKNFTWQRHKLTK